LFCLFIFNELLMHCYVGGQANSGLVKMCTLWGGCC